MAAERMSIDDYKVLIGKDVPKKKTNTRSKEKEKLAQYLLYGARMWTKEYAFHPTRKWRFDWVLAGDPVSVGNGYVTCEPPMIAVEFEGGVFTGGGHTRGGHYDEDCEKYSEAAILGWMVIRVTAKMVQDGRAFDLIERAVKARMK